MNLPRVCLRLLVGLIACLAVSFPTHSQWSRTAGSEGGFALALLSTPDFMLIGLESGGVYRSTDDGVTWLYASTGFTGMEPGGNAFALLGTRVFVSTGFGIDVSVDQGLTWTPANNGLPPPGVNIAGFAVRGAEIFAGAGSYGVYRSLDSGATWSRTPGTPADSDVSTIFSTGAYLYVGTYEGGVFRSSDNGGSWQSASTGLAPGDGMRILSFAAGSGTLIVGTREGAYRSTNNGDSWTLATSGLTSMAVPTVLGLGTYFLAGTYGGGVYRSTNAGINWVSSTAGWPGANVRALCVRNGAIFGANYGLKPLYKSTDDGALWTPTGNGITAELLYTLAGNESRVFSGAYGGVHITSDNGATWTTPSALSGVTIGSLCFRGGRVFAGTSYNGPYVSTDDGTTWTAANGGLSSSSARSTLALAGDSLSLFAGTYGGVYRSTDNGTSWLAASSGLTDTMVYALCSANGRLFAGTRTGMYMSTNSGSLWTALTNGLPAQRVASIVSINGDILVAYALGGNPSVYRSTDNGLAWHPVSNGLSGGAVIQTLFVEGGAVFGGTNSMGVWLSTDRGENWSDISQGLSGPGLKISALTSSGGYLFSGATKGGIWSRPLSQVVSVESGPPRSVAESFSLEQNYPNPFNPRTEIGFRTTDHGWVTLKVYDVLGREVARLVDGPLTPGEHIVTFYPSGLGSGVYFYELQSGATHSVRSMTFLK